MEIKIKGKIIKGVGGLYQVRLCADDAQLLRGEGLTLNDSSVLCKARGVFRHEKLTLLVGDDVTLRIDTELAAASEKASANDKRKTEDACGGVMIEEVLPRSCELIRPPISNIDTIFVVFAAAMPDPAPSTIDKLITIAEYKEIEPVIVITKADIAT